MEPATISSTENGINVLFVLVERGEGEEYAFHPVRRGKVVRSSDYDGKFNVYVRLEDLVLAKTKSCGQQLIIDNCWHRPRPKLDQTDSVTDDGDYAIIGESPDYSSLFKWGSGSAMVSQIADRLAEGRVFTTTKEGKNYDPIYSSILLRPRDKDEPCVPNGDSTEPGIHYLLNKADYVLDVSFNNEREDVSFLKVDVNGAEAWCGECNGRSETISIPLNFSESKTQKPIVSIAMSRPGDIVLKTSLFILLRTPKLRITLAVLGLFVYILVGILAGDPFSQLPSAMADRGLSGAIAEAFKLVLPPVFQALSILAVVYPAFGGRSV